MTPDSIHRAARALVEARRERQPLAGLPADCRPSGPQEGYEVQRAFITQWGEPIAGWKAGATAGAIQARFGLTEPFLGPIFSSTVLKSPASAPAGSFTQAGPESEPVKVGLEVEFAFHFGRSLPARKEGHALEAVLAAVDSLVPALEIITPRFASLPFDRVGEAIADCGVNGGIVLGEPVKSWREVDLASHCTRQLVDGVVIAEGTGALVLGHPINALLWLTNALARQGTGVSAGQILTTGSMTGIQYVGRGVRAVGDFGSLGRVEVQFT